MNQEWRSTPPTTPGTYQWRRSSQWEPITREVDGSGLMFSHRYQNKVPLERLGGEWLY